MISNPIWDEIRQAGANKQSGVLTLSADGCRVDAFYREGLIQAVSSNLESRRVGDYLIQAGYLTERETHGVSKHAKKKKQLFGEAAVFRGRLDPPELADVVRRQCVELLQHAAANNFTVAGFENSLRSFYTPANIAFPYLLLEICRSEAPPLAAGASVPVTLKSGLDLSGLPWYPEELSVLSALTYPATVGGLLAATGIKEEPLRRILGVFHRLDVIEIGSQTETASGETALVKRSGFPFDGLIPAVTNAVSSEKLEVLHNSNSFISEQFRNLKVRISETREVPPKVITVSSPETADGKSLISANLAVSFSMETGRRVIIIDCDLRDPSLHRYLGVSPQPGLLQYLSGGPMAPHCYVRRIQDLFFLTAGGTADNPLELLSLHRMKDLIEYFKTDFDTIILDAPPFFPIADARIITALSDGFIMVIRRGRTSYRNIENAFRVSDQKKFLGVVFNDVKPMLFHSSYYSGCYDYGRKTRLYANGRKVTAAPKKYLES